MPIYTLFTCAGEREVVDGGSLKEAYYSRTSNTRVNFIEEGEVKNHLWCAPLTLWIACDPAAYCENRSFTEAEIEFIVAAKRYYFEYGIGSDGKLFAQKDHFEAYSFGRFPDNTDITIKESPVDKNFLRYRIEFN